MGRSDKNGAIPDGWRIARLGDVATLRPSQQDSDTDNDLPYVGLKHIANGGTLISTDAAGDYISLKTRFEAGDTLFGKLRPNLRKVVRAPFNGMASTEILAIVARSPADKKFLSYVLRSDPMHNHTMQGITGTKMPRTSWSHMKNYGFLLPPLREQRAIAAVLDSIDEAIERTETVIAATEQVRDSLLHELLTCGVPGWHREWKEAPGVGTIPADWNVVRLGDVAEIAFSSVDKKTVDGEVPIELCNYTDVFYNRRIRPGMGLMSATASPVECDRWALRKGDVLFTKDSESPDEIGIPAYVTADMPRVLCGYHLGLARPSDELTDGAYLAELLRSPRTARQFARIANGITRFGLTLGATNSLTIPLPPLLEQQTIATLLDSVDDATDRARRERDALQTMKGSVADALLTGRMRASSRTDKH